MNEPSIKLVACPCCRAPLYTLEWNRSTAKWDVAKDSPSLAYDAEGSFMECVRCRRRIAIIEAPVHAEEPFFLAALQSCKRCGAEILRP
jgi:uncharacterized protein YbaR (Trm112 family)